jgi:hypothetical protein
MRDKTTYYDKLIAKLKNNKWIAYLLIVFAILVGTALALDALGKIESYFRITQPSKKEAEIEKNLQLKRIFSVRTGNCFDVNGYMNCFYCKVQIDENTYGYLIYEADRTFTAKDKIPTVYDKEGNNLTLLTPDDAKVIKKWGKDNPYLPIPFSNY